jgi:hypothetical protein
MRKNDRDINIVRYTELVLIIAYLPAILLIELVRWIKEKLVGRYKKTNSYKKKLTWEILHKVDR